MRELRLEFLVKLYLAHELDPALAATLVAEHRTHCECVEASLTADLAVVEGPSRAETGDHDFTTIVIDLRLEQTRAALKWLNRVQAGLHVRTRKRKCTRDGARANAPKQR